MAETPLHERDTRIALQGTTRDDNIEIIIKAVHLVIDGTYETKNSNKNFLILDFLIYNLKKYGIDENSLYKDFLDQGVDPNLINNGLYRSKMHYLQEWLLPKDIGDNKRQFTHKGADYRYDINKEDNKHNDWTGNAKQQSWEVKKKLLIDTIVNIYSIPPNIAQDIAMTLYSIHRLRDLSCSNVEDPSNVNYLFNLPNDLINHTLPLIKNEVLLNEVIKSIDKLQISIGNTKSTNIWDADLVPCVDDLLGAADSEAGGLLSKVVSGVLEDRQGR